MRPQIRSDPRTGQGQDGTAGDNPLPGRGDVPQQTGVAEVNGARLHYAVEGDGEPLVLVHAGIADARMWDEQVPVFAREYRVIRYDMRGFGRSAPAEGAYAHHEDLRELLDFLGVDRASFVGCSMGGAVVIDFALENPQRAEALILVGSAVGGFDLDVASAEEWDEVVVADAAGDLRRVSELEVRMWVDGPERSPDAVDSTVRDLVREMNLIALQNEALEIGEEREPETPAVDRLGDIRYPVLILVGDHDRPGVLAAAERLDEEIPDARKVVIPGTAHLPNMERPKEFDQLVLEHLAQR